MSIAIFVRFSIFWFVCLFFFSSGAASDPLFPVDPTWFSRYSEENRAGGAESLPKSSRSLLQRSWDPRARPGRTRSRRGASSRERGRERSERCAAAGAAPLPPRTGPTAAGRWLKNISLPRTRKTAISGSKGLYFSGENSDCGCLQFSSLCRWTILKISTNKLYRQRFFYFYFVPNLVYNILFGFTPDLLQFIPDVAPCQPLSSPERAWSVWKRGTVFHQYSPCS